jgi:hypothetical protein
MTQNDGQWMWICPIFGFVSLVFSLRYELRSFAESECEEKSAGGCGLKGR